MREVETGRSTELDAPAKLNLGLRVLGRREDGYHEIESLFVPLDLCDRVRVEADAARARGVGTVELTLHAPSAGSVPADGSNLAARAATAFLDASGASESVRIELWKRVPAGAGLGGGSSDAASVLRALSELLPGRVSAETLRTLALALGADVPFFLQPAPALVTGIGERIDPVKPWPALDFVLAKPPASLDTAAVYAAYDDLAAQPAPPGGAGRAWAELAESSDSERARWIAGLAASGLLRNDLERAAAALCPAVGSLRLELGDLGAVATGMSGSGPTVFGVFADRGAAHTAQAALVSPAWSRVAASQAAE